MVSKAQRNQSQIQECPPSSIWLWLLNLKPNHFQLHKWQGTNCPSFYYFKDGHLSSRKQTIANAALILYSRDQVWNQNSTATKLSDLGHASTLKRSLTSSVPRLGYPKDESVISHIQLSSDTETHKGKYYKPQECRGRVGAPWKAAHKPAWHCRKGFLELHLLRYES